MLWIGFFAVESFRKHKLGIAVSAALIAIALLANLAFVNVSRTALVYSLVLAALFAYRYLGRRQFWIACHLLTFRGGGVVAWIGLDWSQNILSSLFNSHLSDFYQGWLYVLAVGIAAGTLKSAAAPQGEAAALKPNRS